MSDMLKKSYKIVALVALSGLATQAAVITIDNFNTGSVYLNGPTGSAATPFTACWYQNATSNNSSCNSAAYGGAAINMPTSADALSGKDTIRNARYEKLVVTQLSSGASAGSAKLNINGDVQGAFNLSTDAQTTANAYLQWDGGQSNTSAINWSNTSLMLQQDLLTSSQNNSFRLRYQTDNGGVVPPTTTILISVYTDATHFSTSRFTVPATGFGAGYFDFYAMFASFIAGGTNGGANFGLVNAITMSINTAPGSAAGLDFILDSFDAVLVVPEPGTYMFVAAGLAGVLAFRRKNVA